MVNRKLKAYRAEKSLNQGDLAKYLHMTRATYNRKELDLTEFTLSEALKISIFLGDSVENVFPEKYKSIFFESQVNANETKGIYTEGGQACQI